MKKNAVKFSYHKTSYQVFLVIWITFCMLFSLLSLYVTLLNSFKSNYEIITDIFKMPSLKTLFANIAHNYSLAYGVVIGPFARSVFVSVIGAIGDCALGVLLGYIFAYKSFPFKNFLFMLFISVMLIPSIMGMPILYPFVSNTLGLKDTFFGYLLPSFAGGQVAAMFLFTTFFGQIPASLFESARIDGANEFTVCLKITVPLAFPIILYKFVGTFGGLYNDYLWPGLILDSKITLMPIMTTKKIDFEKIGENGAVYAMFILSSVPLVITSAISMKFFSSGDFAAGMKL
ncbi:MAG: carbohydrate ABC transporter permease [Candidatus Scatosoma sp.]